MSKQVRVQRANSSAPGARPRPVVTGVAAACASLLLHGAARAQAQEAAEAPRVEVVGTSPLPGTGMPRDQLPYATTVVRRAALDTAQADHLTDHLARRVAGAGVSDIQGSTFQGDFSFRGHRASGLLGASQGLSVYLDGVRVNEPFGDVVNWDLIPEFALQSVSLVPGANPAFGLNTLGGAVSMETASGRTAPGGQAEVLAGSHGRLQLSASQGTAPDAEGWHRWIGASLFREDGWRDHSPGRSAQALLKLGRDQGDTRWSTQLWAGRSRLVGNGLVPQWTLEDDGGEVERTADLGQLRRSAVYTHPDRTENRLAQWQFNLQQRLAGGRTLDGLVYLRHTQRDTVNGDVADAVDPAAPDLNASLNTTHARQTAAGLALSLSGQDGAHRWQVGATLDAARMRYRQLEQEGRFSADRGVQAGDDEAELSAAVRGESWNLGVFASDTWQLGAGTFLTATLRANHARVASTLTRVDDGTGEAEDRPREAFHYRSLNPALGLSHRLAPTLTAFANLARNTRVPTIIELGCADPAEPCRLPAGLQSDPFLKQVRSHSAEAGLRWRPAGAGQWQLTAWRTDNHDDIVFGSVSATSQLGYFRNFALTRHQGLDLSWEMRWGDWALDAGYALLDATWQAHDTLRVGERNLAVHPGMRMAGVPRHSLKLGVDRRLPGGWSVGADLQALSRRGVMGNEDGRLEDGGDSGHDLSLPGTVRVNLRASWQPRPGWTLMARVLNAANRRDASFGALGETVFNAQGQYTGTPREALFVAPGAPRSVQLGARLAF